MNFATVFRRVTAVCILCGMLMLSFSLTTGCSEGSSPGGNNNVNGGGNTAGPGLNDPPDLSRAACQPNTRNRARPRWTVLVFINAANNLQPDSLLNIAQMASVGSDEDLNIVVQWKQANCVDCGSPTFNATRRYFIRRKSAADVVAIRNGNTTVLDSDRLADPPSNDPFTNQSDMGDFRVLRDFVQWGSTTYPADHLAVVIWNHGSGWRPINRSATNRVRPVFRAVSQDNATNNEISTQEIPIAISTAAQPVDMLIFDASLMMMTEVAYEVRNQARVMVGSEDSPPGAGYPYDAWLNALKSSGTDPCDVGDDIVRTFVANYPTSTNITQAVIDLSKMQSVATALNNFGNALLNHVNDQALVIQNARTNAQRYAFNDNKDLYHFANIIWNNTTADDLKQAAFEMQAALRGANAAVIYNGRGSLQQQNSQGMAVYVPNPGGYLNSYNDLALSRVAPRWAQFLQSQRQ